MNKLEVFTGNSGDSVILSGDFVIKVSSVKNHTAFKRQMDFLLNKPHQSFISVEKINDNCYIMPYIHRTFFNFILDNKNDIEKCEHKFKELLQLVTSYSKTNDKSVEIKSYLDKLEGRVEYIFDASKSTLNISDSFGFVHGDLTFSNVLLDDNDNFVLIDPRGSEEHTFYDFGKLAQSVKSYYELELYELNSDDVLKKIYNRLSIVLDDYVGDKELLNFYHAVHLIGAFPFFKANNRPYADAFLQQGFNIFNTLNIKIMEKTD